MMFFNHEYDNFFGGMNVGPTSGPGNFQEQLQGSWVRSMGRNDSDSIGPSNIKSLFRTHVSCTHLWAPHGRAVSRMGPLRTPLVLRATSPYTSSGQKSTNARGARRRDRPPQFMRTKLHEGRNNFVFLGPTFPQPISRHARSVPICRIGKPQPPISLSVVV